APALQLISGPGCPVCVTDDGYLQSAVQATGRGYGILTFGDMLRVPGPLGSLQAARARGAAVDIVYSPLDAVLLARREPERRFVFLAVGFETTAPGIAAAVMQAPDNLFFLCGLKRVMPALAALFGSEPRPAIDGLLLPGHVSAIIGAGAYRAFAQQHRLPCVVGGFTPTGMALALAELAERIGRGDCSVGNAYRAVVQEAGNARALTVLDEVLRPVDAVWRGLGSIPQSGYALAAKHAARALATVEPDLDPPQVVPNRSGCRCGEVLAGRLNPRQCPLFGTTCTPAAPAGACMVSSEGSCAAAYQYGA
ncbi:MAG TPA: hydrogenase formation protein HypD, partial [bacterium]|nr:hydrogenase formation protein HypD [bacterium]